MKYLVLLLAIVSFSFTTEAQVRWPFGQAEVLSGGTNDTIDLSDQVARGLNYYAPANDTTILINLTTVDTEVKTGDLLIIEATEGTGSADTLRYGTNITGLEDPVPAGKTKIITFIYNGSEFVKLAVTQID